MTKAFDSTDHPSRIGPYRILDVLGEGGMAVVYLAEQSEPVKRHVALKILKLGMDTKQIVARFESERQALAVLDHPNIAKIFDGGISESGRPYFVMERVKGVPITEYCDNQRLSNKERLMLFVRVCSAVQHAHLKGLIHRDLKPSNILVGVVDGNPQPKIIDFGIAKATSTPLTEATLYTRIGQVVGTPQYMSPEQADLTDVDIDSRTDIYSLGIVLYELLVGTAPLDLRAVADQALRVAIREQDHPKPSARYTTLGDTRDEIAKIRRTDPDRLRRQLRGDLDWVVMRAIEKDRTRRYETVNALSMECKRFLDFEPVLARPPSPGYLLRRFVRRNRMAVIAASVALLAVLAGATGATLAYFRATEAELVAVKEAEAASQISDFLVELFEVSDPSEARGNSITAREVLDRGGERIRTSLQDQPLTRARMLMTLGYVYEALGLFEEARLLMEDAYEIRRTELGDDHDDTDSAIAGLAGVALNRGDYVAMEKYARESLRINRKLHGEGHPSTIAAFSDLSAALSGLGEDELAAKYSREALAMARQSDDVDDQALESYVRRTAIYLEYIGEHEAAERLYKESLTLSQQIYGDVHPNVAFALDNLALHYSDVENHDAAAPLYWRALNMLKQVYGPDHPEVAQTMGNVAGYLVDIGENLEQARSLATSALAIDRRQRPDHEFIGDYLVTLANIEEATDNHEAAEQRWREALQQYSGSLSKNRPEIWLAMAGLGGSLLAQNKLAEAEQVLMDCYQSLSKSDSDRDTLIAVIEDLISLYERLDAPDRVDEFTATLTAVEG